MTQTALQPPAETTDLVAVIRGVLAAEQEAIDHYNALIKLCDGTDYVTQDLAIKILSDEEGHRQEFEGYLKEYVKG
jgi:bacterioferritin